MLDQARQLMEQAPSAAGSVRCSNPSPTGSWAKLAIERRLLWTCRTALKRTLAWPTSMVRRRHAPDAFDRERSGVLAGLGFPFSLPSWAGPTPPPRIYAQHSRTTRPFPGSCGGVFTRNSAGPTRPPPISRPRSRARGSRQPQHDTVCRELLALPSVFGKVMELRPKDGDLYLARAVRTRSERRGARQSATTTGPPN